MSMPREMTALVGLQCVENATWIPGKAKYGYNARAVHLGHMKNARQMREMCICASIVVVTMTLDHMSRMPTSTGALELGLEKKMQKADFFRIHFWFATD